MYTLQVIYLSTVTQRHSPNSEITAQEALKTPVTNIELQMKSRLQKIQMVVSLGKQIVFQFKTQIMRQI